MEKILVAIDGKHGAWDALSHACFLAKRINIELNVLLVTPKSDQQRSHSETKAEDELRRSMALHVEAAKADGIMINYFIAEGDYEDEVINFVNQNRITLLMHETQDGDGRSGGRKTSSLRTLRHRVACRMEIVAPKKHNS